MIKLPPAQFDIGKKLIITKNVNALDGWLKTNNIPINRTQFMFLVKEFFESNEKEHALLLYNTYFKKTYTFSFTDFIIITIILLNIIGVFYFSYQLIH